MMSPIIMMIYFFVMFSTIMLVSSSSWFIMWLGLEFNMMSFIPLIYSFKNSISFESMMKYFLIQVLGSMTFIIPFMICLNILTLKKLWIILMMTLAMLLKLAASPFHQWFTSLAEGLSWKVLTVLMTWQKISPYIIMFLITNNYVMMMSSILSVMIGTLKAFNQTKLKKIMVLSSISHIGWMISVIFLKPLWMMYLMIYSWILISVTTMFYMNYLNTLYQLYSMNIMYLIMINMLSLSGLPPLLGFLPKWLSLNYILLNLPMLSIPFIFSSILNIYIYMQILFKSLLIYKNKLVSKNMEKLTILSSSSFLLIPLLIMM